MTKKNNNDTIELKMFLLLILANFFWGGTFSVVKLSVATMDVYSFLFFRFLIASLVLLMIYPSDIFNIGKNELNAGCWVGFTMICGYVFQTAGLKYTTASKAGFVMILSIISVPILSKIFLKQNMQKNTLFGFVAATAGLVILTVQKDMSINTGDILTIISALAFGFQIIAVSMAVTYVKNIIGFTFVELMFVTVFSFMLAINNRSFSLPDTYISMFSILLTATLATAFGFIIQSKAQSVISATKASLTYATEPVFAALLGTLILGELFTLKEASGAVLIFIGMMLSEKNLFKLIFSQYRRNLVPKKS